MTSAQQVFIGLGGNTGDPVSTFRNSLPLLAAHVGAITKCSPLYRTKPLNPPELQDTSQPDFFNMVLELRSTLSPTEILTQLLHIERSMGRNRELELRWGPRTLDLDILLVDQLVVDSEDLVLPHPRMHERDFVLQPLADIAPLLYHPTSNKTIRTLLEELHSTHAACFVLERVGLLESQLNR